MVKEVSVKLAAKGGASGENISVAGCKTQAPSSSVSLTPGLDTILSLLGEASPGEDSDASNDGGGEKADHGNQGQQNNNTGVNNGWLWRNNSSTRIGSGK